MTNSPQINPDLVDWARQAGYAFGHSDQLGAALFWTDPGGETRLFVRGSAGMATLTSADRGEDEVFVLSSPGSRLSRTIFGTSSDPTSAQNADCHGWRYRRLRLSSREGSL